MTYNEWNKSNGSNDIDREFKSINKKEDLDELKNLLSVYELD